MYVFFFQAEDGIRDIGVTGVQTCALPIFYYPIEEVKGEWKSIPYGYALSNQKFYVLDRRGEICPVGVEGELYIGGRGLALEYRNDVEKTKESFIQHEKRSEEHTSELQSRQYLVCRLLLEKKKKIREHTIT